MSAQLQRPSAVCYGVAHGLKIRNASALFVSLLIFLGTNTRVTGDFSSTTNMKGYREVATLFNSSRDLASCLCPSCYSR